MKKLASFLLAVCAGIACAGVFAACDGDQAKNLEPPVSGGSVETPVSPAGTPTETPTETPEEIASKALTVEDGGGRLRHGLDGVRKNAYETRHSVRN